MLQLLSWKILIPWVAAVLSLGGLVWYYGEVKHDEGVSEVQMKIAEGKYDRWFVTYETLPAPKTIIRRVVGKTDSTDKRLVDSLFAALNDSSRVIAELSSSFTATLQDSATYGADSLQFTFRAVHRLHIDRIRKIVTDTFEALPMSVPIKEVIRPVLRDPTFWEDVETFLYGVGSGVMAVLLVLAFIV